MMRGFEIRRAATPLLLVVVMLSILDIAFSIAARVIDLDDTPVEVTNGSTLRARLATLEGEHKAAFVGDSLIFGENLRRRGGWRWSDRALPAEVERLSRDAVGRPRIEAVNLGMNGLLNTELECLLPKVLAKRPEFLVVNLSPRPFSADFDRPDAVEARRWLCDAPSPLSTAFDAVLPVFAKREALRSVFADAAGNVKPLLAASEDDDEKEALDRMLIAAKAAARYDSIHVGADRPQAIALARWIEAARSAEHTRTLVFYLEEDLGELEGKLDAARLHREEEKLAAIVEANVAGANNVRFLRIPSENLRGLYDDHVHLVPAGYTKLAEILIAELLRP